MMWCHVTVTFRVPMVAVREILVKMVESAQKYVIPRALGTTARAQPSLLERTVRLG